MPVASIRLIVVVLVCLVCAISPAAAKRIALVIGNSNYASAQSLPNATRDAEVIEGTFRRLGFEVIAGYDLDQSELADLLLRFDGALDGAEVAAFYYAGHGVQFEGVNYLVGTRAVLDNPYSLSGEAMPLDAIVDIMEAKGAVNMIFLDACRNNPFVERMQSKLPPSRSLATARGLAPVTKVRPETMIMYATASNEVALDGDGENSPFAAALARHLAAPDTEIGLAMKRVIRDVRDATGGEQAPELLTALSVELYLKISIGEPAKTETEAPGNPTRPAGLGVAEANRELERMFAQADESANLGRDRENLTTLDVAQKFALSYFGEDSVQYGRASNALIGAYTGLGRIEDAIYAAREAIRVFTLLNGADDLMVAGDKANLAARLRVVGEREEAERLWLEAIATLEAAGSGTDHFGLAAALDGYSQLLMEKRQLDDALATSLKSVAALEPAAGTPRINHGWTWANHAYLLRNLGRCVEAKEAFGRAVVEFERAGVATSQRDHADALKMAARTC